jgi:hypothetical protein
MKGKLTIAAIAFAVILCITVLGGCAQSPPSQNNTTVTPVNVTTPIPSPAPVPVPASGSCSPTGGHVFYNGSIVPGSMVEALTSDGTYSASNVSNSSGAYFLLMPPGAQFNITATYGNMKRAVWPAFPGYTYDVNLTPTTKSYITGTGKAAGGPIGFNSSLYNLTGIQIIADRGLGYPPITAFSSSDGRYTLEVEPGVKYHVHGAATPSTWLFYHNTNSGGLAIDITLRPDETALIDYAVVLPSAENSVPIMRS